MEHKKTIIIFALIASSLLTESAFAGRTGYIVPQVQPAKPATQAQRAKVAGSLPQAVVKQEAAKRN
jgi:hypothetical protein